MEFAYPTVCLAEIHGKSCKAYYLDMQTPLSYSGIHTEILAWGGGWGGGEIKLGGGGGFSVISPSKKKKKKGWRLAASPSPCRLYSCMCQNHKRTFYFGDSWGGRSDLWGGGGGGGGYSTPPPLLYETLILLDTGNKRDTWRELQGILLDMQTPLSY